jgi:hypothetical protein
MKKKQKQYTKPELKKNKIKINFAFAAVKT